mgnify:CR=1 FL=1
MTLSGGAGALAADVATDVGLVVEPWDDATRQRVAGRLPYFASTANPIDVTGAMINDTAILDHTLQVACESAETDVVLVVLGNADKAAQDLIEAVTRWYSRTDKPFFVTWTGGTGKPRADLLAASVPTYSEPMRAVRAIGRLVDFSLRPASVDVQ